MPVQIPGLEGLEVTQQGYDFTITYLTDSFSHPASKDHIDDRIAACEQVVGVDNVIATATKWLLDEDSTTCGDSGILDQWYGEGHVARCKALIETLRDDHVYTVSFRVGYGVIVIF